MYALDHGVGIVICYSASPSVTDILLGRVYVRAELGVYTEPSGPVTLIVLVTGVGLRPSTSKPAMECIDCAPARLTKTISLGQPA
jgi:hypothetical protein